MSKEEFFYLIFFNICQVYEDIEYQEWRLIIEFQWRRKQSQEEIFKNRNSLNFKG